MEEGLLDADLIQSPTQLQALPIVRVLQNVWLREVAVWSVISFFTLVAPLLLGPDTAPKTMLVLLIIGLSCVVLGYTFFVFTPAKDDIAQYGLRLVVVQVGLCLVVASTAVLLHPVAATCFALSMWCAALAVLLRLVHQQDIVAPARDFAWHMLIATLLVCFVCIMQQLSWIDFGINLAAMTMALMGNYFRWDWLANHALHNTSTTAQTEKNPCTYNLKEHELAWNELYAWTVRTRVIDRIWSS